MLRRTRDEAQRKTTGVEIDLEWLRDAVSSYCHPKPGNYSGDRLRCPGKGRLSPHAAHRLLRPADRPIVFL